MGKTGSPKQPARRSPAALLVAVTLLSGCQCGPLYEGYAGFVDGVSDQLPLLERFYVPQLDISRLGQPDWCQSPINRLLAPCACRHVVHQAEAVPVAVEATEAENGEAGGRDTLRAGPSEADAPIHEGSDIQPAALSQGGTVPDAGAMKTE